MKTKHTPSAWVVSGGIVKTSDGLYNVCDCLISYSLTTSEMEANARLIAAAPELLQFAEWAMGQLCGESGTGETHWEQFPEFVAGQAAIAKATGKEKP